MYVSVPDLRVCLKTHYLFLASNQLIRILCLVVHLWLSDSYCANILILQHYEPLFWLVIQYWASVCLYKSSSLKALPYKTYHLQATSNDENIKRSLTLGVSSEKIWDLADERSFCNMDFKMLTRYKYKSSWTGNQNSLIAEIMIIGFNFLILRHHEK